jgi:26S proteasome regulatory subunit N1
MSNILFITGSFSCVPYVAEPENTNLLKTALEIYKKYNKYPDAMLCCIQLNDMELIKNLFLSCGDP